MSQESWFQTAPRPLPGLEQYGTKHLKLRRVSVNGFARLHETSLTDLPDGLILIEGTNGSGKSTLFNFLKTILFGPKGERHAPVRGGAHGGYLDVSLGAHSMRIARDLTVKNPVAGKLTITDLSTGSIIPDEGLFGGMNFELYSNVFAINLDILANAEVGEKVQNAIDSALSGTGRDGLPGAIKECEKSIDQLFGKGKQKPEINMLMKELAEAERSLREQSGAPEEYDAKREELAASERQTREAEQTEAALTALAARLEELSKAWASNSELELIEARLSELPPTEHMPGDAGVRFEEAGSIRGEQRRRIEEELDPEIDTLEIRAKSSVDPRLFALKPRIQELRERLGALEDAIAGRGGAEHEARTAQAALSRAIRELGSAWTLDQLQTLPTDLGIQNEANGIINEISLKDQSLNRRQEELAAARREQARTQESLDKAPTPQGGNEPLGSAEIVRRGIGLDAIAAKLQDLATAKARYDSLRLHFGTAETTQGEPRQAYVTLALGAILVGVLGFWAQRSAGALVGALVGLALVWLSSRATRPSSTGAPSGELREQVEAAGKDVERHEAELTELCGEQPLRNASEVAAMRAELSRQELARREWDEISAASAALNQDARSASARVQEAEKELEQAEQALRELSARWEAWLVQHSYPKEILPRQFHTFVQAVESARTTQVASDKAVEAQKILSNRVADGVAAVNAICVELNRAVITEKELSTTIRDLANSLDLAESASASKKSADESLLAKRKERERAEQKVRDAQGTLTALLSECGVDSEEELVLLIEHQRTRKMLAQSRQELIGKLAVLVSPDGVDDLRSDLKTNTKESIDLKLQLAREDLAKTKEFHTELVKRHTTLRNQIEALENSEEVTKRLRQRSELRASIKELASRWAEATLTQLLLTRAQAHFESFHQGPVIEKASVALKHLTADPEARIFASSEKKERFRVQASGFEIRTQGHLNRSLMERLLLALRLGYIEYYSDQNVGFPIVMDDVLVNFDHDHTRLAAQTILETATRHQVIYLTCHPETRSVFANACKDCSRSFDHWMLENWQFRRA